ncbi:MAG: PKD domain-containing protein [Solirubrobacteraceae bacterium]
MRRYSLIARRLVLALSCSLVASLGVAAGAQATVVQDGSGDSFGVALVPGSTGFGGTNYSPDQVTGACFDPGLSADLGGPDLPGGLCLRDSSLADGPTVLTKSELFAFTWDPGHTYWGPTRGYVEQFLHDVAAGAGSLSSPFAVASQYTDALGDRASTPSVYGGGCVDNGATGGYTCQFENSNGSGAGWDYPSGDPVQNCNPSGSGINVCLTDAAIQGEVSRMLASTGVGSIPSSKHVTPLIVMLTPPNVEVCLDHVGDVCSVNSNASAKFCTYHSRVNGIPYVVLPWTIYTGCDEPQLPTLPTNPTPEQVTTDAGTRLVSPLSGGLIAAMVNPFLNGWFGNDGTEIDDVCGPAGADVDTVTVGSGSYALEREWNNAAELVSDPFTYGGCAPSVVLEPSFVDPTAVEPGDTVQFDGSTSPSTLIVPKDNYQWNFGDGTTAAGPSVEHSYAAGGNYSVTLKVTDRGNNTATLVQTVQVLGANGQPSPPSGGSGSGGSGSGSGNALQVHLQLQPQSLTAVLRNGISVRVTSNAAANGIATVVISRKAARRAHIKTGKGPTVRIGLGTVASIKNGSVLLRLHLSAATAAKLRHVGHVDMTIRLALVAAGNQRIAVDAAASY